MSTLRASEAGEARRDPPETPALPQGILKILEEGARDFFWFEWRFSAFFALACLTALVFVLVRDESSLGLRIVVGSFPLVILLVRAGLLWRLREKKIRQIGEEMARVFSAKMDLRRRDVSLELSPRSSRIDELYVELRQLQTQEDTPEKEARSRVRFQELRRLQKEEADWMRQSFESSLHLKPGEGWRALEIAERLLKDEDPSPAHLPTAGKN